LHSLSDQITAGVISEIEEIEGVNGSISTFTIIFKLSCKIEKK